MFDKTMIVSDVRRDGDVFNKAFKDTPANKAFTGRETRKGEPLGNDEDGNLVTESQFINACWVSLNNEQKKEIKMSRKDGKIICEKPSSLSNLIYSRVAEGGHFVGQVK